MVQQVGEVSSNRFDLSMNDAMEHTSGTEFVGRTFGGAGGVGGGGADVEAPNIGGGNARGGNVAATFGIRPGFDAKQQWITAKKKVQEFVVEQFKSGPAFLQIVKSNFREAVLSRPELYLEASFEVFLFMIACTWFTTCIWNPDVLFASKGGNRINDIFAYNKYT